MAGSEFFFAIDLSGPDSGVMLREVASRVLGQAGCGADAVPRIIDQLESAVARGNDGCRVTFISRHGHLEVAVSSAAGRIWQTTQPLG